MTSPIAGQVALVTGAGSGIGAAIASTLADAGVRLVALDNRPKAAAATAAAIRADGGEAIEFGGDVQDYDDMARAVETAAARYGGIDILIACAGIAATGSIVATDPMRMREVVLTNTVGVMNGIRAALPTLLARGAGHIVVIASVSGRITYPEEAAYVASKHAAVAFADCLRQEVAAAGIRVSLIEPGVVNTPLVRSSPEALDLLPGVVPLDPVDVARAVRFVLEQPANVAITEIVIRPTHQVL